MNARPALFRQADLARALKAAAAAGVHVGRIEIDPSGKIIIVANQQDAAPHNALDDWMRRHAD